MDNNQNRAKDILKRFGFNFKEEYRNEIRQLLEDEFESYQPGSNEYLRVLCGFLFCIGKPEDIELLEKIKYGINFDVGCMIDGEWIENMKGMSSSNAETREELQESYVSYYKSYFSEDA